MRFPLDTVTVEALNRPCEPDGPVHERGNAMARNDAYAVMQKKIERLQSLLEQMHTVTTAHCVCGCWDEMLRDDCEMLECDAAMIQQIALEIAQVARTAANA